MREDFDAFGRSDVLDTGDDRSIASPGNGNSPLSRLVASPTT